MRKFQRDSRRVVIHLLRGATMLLVVSCATWGLADDDDDDEGRERDRRRAGERAAATAGTGAQAAAPAPAAFREECGSCHLAFPPQYLPARSWKKMMSGLADHFGEDASLETPTLASLTDYLTANAADRSSSRRARRVMAGIPDLETPLRLTETKYFRRQHHEISAKVWQREKIKSPANCEACHGGAATGDFSEHRVRIPR